MSLIFQQNVPVDGRGAYPPYLGEDRQRRGILQSHCSLVAGVAQTRLSREAVRKRPHFVHARGNAGGALSGVP